MTKADFCFFHTGCIIPKSVYAVFVLAAYGLVSNGLR